MFGMKKRPLPLTDPRVIGEMTNCVNLKLYDAGARVYSLLNMNPFSWDDFFDQADRSGQHRTLAYVFASRTQGWDPFPSFKSAQWDRHNAWHVDAGCPDTSDLQF
jgi:hypothetical protein